MKMEFCKQYLEEIKEEGKHRVRALKNLNGVTPCVVVFQLGDNEDANRYVRNKTKHVFDIDAYAHVEKLSLDITTETLVNLIHEANYDDRVHGIIVQRPLPSHINEFDIDTAIHVGKDLDCANQRNLGRILSDKSFIHPCTPKGIMYLLQKKNVDLDGKNVLILGRSIIVGKPMQMMLTNSNATVTLAHSRSKIKEFYSYDDVIDGSKYDIIISAIGKGHSIKVDAKQTDCILIDVGINFDEEGKMIGDIDLENCVGMTDNSWATPVPGGVGLLTCGMVIDNLLRLTERVIYNPFGTKLLPTRPSELKFKKGDIVIIDNEESKFNGLIAEVIDYEPIHQMYLVNTKLNKVIIAEKYLRLINY